MMHKISKGLQAKKKEDIVIEASIQASINQAKSDLKEELEIIWELKAASVIAAINLHTINQVIADLRVDAQEVEVIVEVKGTKTKY
jgi:hypothetical protein